MAEPLSTCPQYDLYGALVALVYPAVTTQHKINLTTQSDAWANLVGSMLMTTKSMLMMLQVTIQVIQICQLMLWDGQACTTGSLEFQDMAEQVIILADHFAEILNQKQYQNEQLLLIPIHSEKVAS